MFVEVQLKKNQTNCWTGRKLAAVAPVVEVKIFFNFSEQPEGPKENTFVQEDPHEKYAVTVDVLGTQTFKLEELTEEKLGYAALEAERQIVPRKYQTKLLGN